MRRGGWPGRGGCGATTAPPPLLPGPGPLQESAIDRGVRAPMLGKRQLQDGVAAHEMGLLVARPAGAHDDDVLDAVQVRTAERKEVVRLGLSLNAFLRFFCFRVLFYSV